MLRPVLVILSGNAAASLFLLLRNLLLARLLPVADYGVASTFAMVMAVVEMASAFGLQQQIVQSKRGDDPVFQAALQGFQLLRGVISGLFLCLTAGVMARFLGIPEVAWAYQVLALVPVLNALVHFDIHRMNRRMVFGPMLLTGAIPALLSLLAAWPLLIWLGDWRVMLAAILLQAALTALASHLLAERPWRIRFDREIYGGSLRFGWPLLLNGVMLFLVFQGDKMIVGRELGMEVLALFSMGMTLTLTPTLLFGKTLQNFFLPRLSQATETGEFLRLARMASEANLLCGGIFVLLLTLGAELILGLLLGAKYAPLVPFLAALGVLQAVRQAKGGASAVAVARGQTENTFYANVLRVLVLPLTWALVWQGYGLWSVIAVSLLGEIAGLGVAFALQSRRQGVTAAPLAGVLSFWAATLGLGLASGIWPEALSLRLAACAAAVLMVVSAPSLRQALAGRRSRG